ncbi:MAG: hypothetical protein JSW27_25345 [Phycisphaerales bacterium]|nr:MAG: hypothetical protein JSW27_25345 [Phycisphaerales bacterium]
MYRLAMILLVLAGGALLAGNAAATEDSDASQLAERVRAHINEQMYKTCKSVVLQHKANAVYRGHAEFLNGVRVDLEVSTSDGAIEYRFLPRPELSTLATEKRLVELEATVTWQKAEIARLRGLCLRAGIEVDPPGPQATPARSEDVNSIATESTSESQPIVYEDREAIAEEPPRFTWRVYERIRKNMGYADVANMLGDGGDLISGSYFDDARNDVIVWTNPDDSHICVVFRDGMVLVKTQFGLPESALEPPR